MGTIPVTGSASGIGLATALQLEAGGHCVIGVDVRDADIVADLGNPEGRRHAADAVAEMCDGVLDAAVTCAGLGGPASRRRPAKNPTIGRSRRAVGATGASGGGHTASRRRGRRLSGRPHVYRSFYCAA